MIDHGIHTVVGRPEGLRSIQLPISRQNSDVPGRVQRAILPQCLC